MRAVFALLFAVLALVSAAGARAGDTKPSWKAHPDPDQLQQFYPQAAMQRGLAGSARIECPLSADGTLHDCRVLNETPPGVGFGKAAIRATVLFQMQPGTRNGHPVDGSVIIPVKFVVPPPTPIDLSDVQPDLIALSLEALVLLAMVLHWRDIGRSLQQGRIRTIAGADYARSDHPIRYRLWATTWVATALLFTLIFVFLMERQVLVLFGHLIGGMG